MARNMSDPVKTFSVGFREDAANELSDARFVAEHFGADHTELELSFSEDAVPLEDLVWHLDEPLADLSALGFHALCELAVRDVTVALSGQGADELFGGYDKHRAAWALGLVGHVPGPAVRAAARMAALGPEKLRRSARAARARGPVERLLAMSGDMDDERRRRLYRGALADVDGGAAGRAVSEKLDGTPDDPLATTLYLDGQLALPDLMLHYFDRTSMAHSLEVRVPFLDHELVELCATIPGRHKVRRSGGKIVLREAARGIVPERILDKPKVGFFANAVDAWMRTRLRDEVGARLVHGELHCAEVLDAQELRTLAEDFVEQRSTAPRGRLLLSVLMLEVWLGSYLDRARTAAARAAA
jgi:asparagine synthase (glutamine-hydrolysing)